MNLISQYLSDDQRLASSRLQFHLARQQNQAVERLYPKRVEILVTTQHPYGHE